MEHEIYRVVSFEPVRPFILQVSFDDGTQQTIDFRPVLAAKSTAHCRTKNFSTRWILTLRPYRTWPNGADFHPFTGLA